MEFNKYEMTKVFSLYIQFYVRFYNTGRINILFFFFSPSKALVSFMFSPLKKKKNWKKYMAMVEIHKA